MFRMHACIPVYYILTVCLQTHSTDEPSWYSHKACMHVSKYYVWCGCVFEYVCVSMPLTYPYVVTVSCLWNIWCACETASSVCTWQTYHRWISRFLVQEIWSKFLQRLLTSIRVCHSVCIYSTRFESMKRCSSSSLILNRFKKAENLPVACLDLMIAAPFSLLSVTESHPCQLGKKSLTNRSLARRHL